MRYMLYGICLGLVSIATFGCGGDSEETGAVADSGGQAPAASPAAAMGGVAMGDAGSSAAPAGAPSGPGAGAGAGTAGGDAAAESGGAGSSAGQIPGQLSAGSPEGDSSAAEGPAAGGTPGAGYAGTTGSPGTGYPGTSASPGGTGYPMGGTAAEGGTSGAGYAGAMSGRGTAGTGEGLSGGAEGAAGTGQIPANYGAGYGNSSRTPGAAGEAGAVSSPGGPGYPGGIPGAEGTPGSVAPQAPATYDEFAKQAFAQGREREAIQYLQAWALTSDEGASEILSNIQWVNSLRRPVMAVRWGVGVQLTAPRGFSGDAKPIGAPQAFPAARGRGEGNPGAGGSGAGVGGAGGLGSAGVGSDGLGGAGLGGGGSAGSGAVAQYAGEFGTAILDKFQSRVSSGKFGKVLKDAPTGGAGSGAGSGYGAAGFGGDDGAGAVGLSGAPAGGGGMRPGMRGGAGGVGSAGGEAQISPGLTLLGIGTDKELKSKAREAGVDVLAIFRVKVTVTRGGFIDNDCDLVLVDPAKEKAPDLFKTSALNNIKVQKDREQNKDDGVQKAVDKLFEFIDKELTLTAMPSNLTPEAVKNTRIGKQLLAGPIDDPLAALTEIRFYHRNKLLADADAIAAMTKVVGDEASAKTLVDGKEDDRKKVVEKWLPKG